MNDTTSYKFKLYEEGDDYDIAYQRVENQEGKKVFVAYNLNECPEDATLSRGLFDAYEYLQAVQFGMDLAALGYNCIKTEYIKDE